MAEALQPFIVNGLFGVAGKLPATKLSEIIISKSSAYSIEVNNNLNSVICDFRDSSYVSRIIAADCSRLSIAALQSTYEANRLCNDKFATPWTVVKIYYSAFYSAHALVRILGGGCCWLENIHVTRLREIASLFEVDFSFKLDPGNYRCNILNSGTSIEWKKLNSGKGTHESFWAYFEIFLRDISEKILKGKLGTRDAQYAYYKILEFIDLGTKRRSNHWMSKIRNDVQYQFEYNIWHSNTLSSKDRLLMLSLNNLWKKDPVEIDLSAGNKLGDLGDLAVASAFLNSLCNLVINRISERGSSGRKSFVHFGPKNFINYRTEIL